MPLHDDITVSLFHVQAANGAVEQNLQRSVGWSQNPLDLRVDPAQPESDVGHGIDVEAEESFGEVLLEECSGA